MKQPIYCPHCIERNERVPKEDKRKPQILAYVEDVVGRGVIEFWCKKCRKTARIDIREYSLDQ
ncbi:hypothetical protein [uncultured Muribaculum sp.]|uniref:hypothetical protein n=1 Tax=uncultured Muribaculum sp. TaxID=1918613 RepID=UPI002730AB2A|nr:hypothetical protein [uncultured Muribaculum sp.]